VSFWFVFGGEGGEGGGGGGGPGKDGGPTTVGAKSFSLLQNAHTSPGSPQSLFWWVHFFFSKALNWPGRKISRLLPSGIEVKNEWKYISNFPVCLQSVEGGKLYVFTLIFTTK